MKNFSMILVAAAATSLAACGGGGGGKTGGGGTTLADFTAKAAAASCTTNVTCGVIAPADLAACQANIKTLAALYSSSAYDVNAAITAKRITFDKTKAQLCLDELTKQTQGCSIGFYFFGNPDCVSVFTGLVPTGGACFSTLECVTGTCDGSAADGCAGTCKAPVAAGGDCDPNGNDCGNSAYCATADDMATTGTCTTFVAVGATCSDTELCDNTHWCRAMTAGGATTCQAPGKIGEQCNLYSGFFTYSDCDPVLRCDTTTNTCAALVVAGGACSDPSDCANGTTCAGLDYDMDGNPIPGTCQAFLAPGATCVYSDTASTACLQNYPCDQTSSTCVSSTLKIGDACTGNDCNSSAGQYCNTNSMQCEQQPAYGATCTVQADPMNDEEPCNSGTCTSGMCTLSCTAASGG